MEKITKIFESQDEVADKLCQLIIDESNECIKARGKFTIAVSGGSVAKFLCNGLPSRKTDWSKWHMFFCDERHVAFDDKECTYTYYKDNLMSKVGLDEKNVYPDDPSISVEEAAKRYEGCLKKVFGDELPRFDLIVLGMGPDGHTCSLFPGHPLLEESIKWVAPISNSPKPPPERITFTFPVLNNSRAALLALCGASKAEILKLVNDPTVSPALPAARVKPTNGKLYWYMDREAAGQLPITDGAQL